MKGSFFSFFVLAWLCLPWLVFSAVTEDYMRYLDGVKNSLNDPDGKLSTWGFNNNSVGLDRLKRFSVANNDLTGVIPSAFEGQDKADFAGNSGLCGGPLGNGGGLSKRNLAIIIAAGVLGAAASMFFGFGIWWWHHLRSVRRRKEGFIGKESL